MCAGACTSVTSRVSVKSSNPNGRSANGSSASFLSSLWDSCPSLLVAGSSLRSDTEPEDKLDAALFPETRCASGPNDSCGSVVEDELLPELTDSPGTTRGTNLSVLHKIVFSSLVNRIFWPLTHFRGLRRVSQATGQQAYPRVVTRLRTDLSHEGALVPPRGCALLHLQSTHYCRVSELFLLCPSLLSLIFFCLACASMLLNRLRILALLVSVMW